MTDPAPAAEAPATDSKPIPPLPPHSTPLLWRLGFLAFVALAGGAVYAAQPGPQAQAGVGIVCFLALAAAASRNLRAVNPRTILWGIAFQAVLAVAVTQSVWVQDAIKTVGAGIEVIAAASEKGAVFVFGDLAKANGPAGFVFCFRVLPPILFISGLFSVLYHFGVLQFFVRLFARAMMYVLGTSGAETLSVAANVFMGQTEAPLIVKPFVPRMTHSELLTLMASGMAHVSGGLLVVYIGYTGDAASVLCTCVMACPCSIYLSKLVLPETQVPETLGTADVTVPRTTVNPVDALATGIKDGLFLALNVAAMLIGFIAFIYLIDAVLGGIKPALMSEFVIVRGNTTYRVGLGLTPEQLSWWADDLSLKWIFGWVFAPLAFLMGVERGEAFTVGQLLGTKLAANEHVALLDLKKMRADGALSDRSQKLAVYALTGFANFASVGIQLGGIGALAPGRRHDLARLGMTALFVGFLATLLNAAIAGVLL